MSENRIVCKDCGMWCKWSESEYCEKCKRNVCDDCAKRHGHFNPKENAK